MALRTPFQIRSIVLAVILVTLCSLITFRWRYSSYPSVSNIPFPSLSDSGKTGTVKTQPSKPKTQSTSTLDYDIPNFEKQVEFWRTFHSLLHKHRPRGGAPHRLKNNVPFDYDPNTEMTRPDLLVMPEKGLITNQEAHQRYIHDLGYQDPRLALVFNPGTKGIVTTVFRKDLPTLVVSLHMLRRTGSALPVEIFLKSGDDYEPKICEDVLAALNAKCQVLSDIMSVDGPFELNLEQVKPFSLLFTSFEHALWMEFDTFPVQDPEVLFKAEPYLSRGLITWPDRWASMISPVYYQIAAQEPTPMSERPTTEGSQIMINKRTHRKSLLLMVYYNFYGPSHYYPLLAQGGPSTGPKETFLAAAQAVGEPYYATHEPARIIGHPTADGGVSGSASIQYDPRQDYKLTNQGLYRAKDPNSAPSPPPLFINANSPRFNPARIFDHVGNDPTRGADGTDSRAWTAPKETMAEFGFDLEARLWEEIKWVACELQDRFDTWRGESGICGRVAKYYINVFLL
ncbi:hypothetical protein FQN54_001169 [Arachnomyces sp. PD_36]|nr:hypothetical protein FQN54_001169 [Arachnomyces sp. PD_36]